jgi:2-C-methyl-D-erythritol 4-phosphate cytidylyltransferase
VAALDSLPSLDFAELVRVLETEFGVDYVEAPASARRVTSADDIELLEALTEPLR